MMGSNHEADWRCTCGHLRSQHTHNLTRDRWQECRELQPPGDTGDPRYSGMPRCECRRYQPVPAPESQNPDPAEEMAFNLAHGLDELAEDDEGWWRATCECGWESPPCPGKEEAIDFFGDHRADG